MNGFPVEREVLFTVTPRSGGDVGWGPGPAVGVSVMAGVDVNGGAGVWVGVWVGVGVVVGV